MPAANASPDPRLEAARILVRVDIGGAHAARLLGGAAPRTRELVLGVLRWENTLDLLLGRHVHQPLRRLEAPIRAVLRLGLYEALRLDAPGPVAVSEAVRVMGRLRPRGSGLVNAVLRRAISERWPAADDDSASLAFRFSHPEWLIERWDRLLGHDLCRRALAADQEIAPLVLLAAASDESGLSRRGALCSRHPYVDGALVVDDGADAVVSALREGEAYAMDAHAILVSRLLPEVSGVVVDLAAAPGGKALALVLERPGLRLVAADRSLTRLRLAGANLAGLQPPLPLVVADGRRPPFAAGSAAAVLLDAPCTGTGTLRRHPEIRWRLEPTDLAVMGEVQRELLAAAAQIVAPGGTILYSTCSLEPEENQDVVECSGLAVLSLAGALPAGARAVELASGGLVLPPGPGGDGFTVHLLGRPRG